MKEVIQLALLQVLGCAVVLILIGCQVSDDPGFDWGTSYSKLGQDYEIENKGLDRLRFVAEIYQSVNDDGCDKYTLNDRRELEPRNSGKMSLSMKCRSATNLRRFLTVTNLNNGREIARLKFLNTKVKVSCDELECTVTCNTMAAVCLMP
jgi:hypothetical protein